MGTNWTHLSDKNGVCSYAAYRNKSVNSNLFSICTTVFTHCRWYDSARILRFQMFWGIWWISVVGSWSSYVFLHVVDKVVIIWIILGRIRVLFYRLVFAENWITQPPPPHPKVKTIKIKIFKFWLQHERIHNALGVEEVWGSSPPSAIFFPIKKKSNFDSKISKEISWNFPDFVNF